MEKSVFRYKVGPQYVDFTGRASVSSMCDLILHAAGEDAHTRGFGIDALAGNNYGWVLSRMCLELDYLPEEYSEFTLYTWISDYNRLSSTRNFTLVNDNGEEFGRAVSQWCMIDFATRMPVDMNTMAKAHEGNMVDAPSPCERPRRIGVVAGEPVSEHRVVYSDIDFNRHMNTMRYIDMIFDSLPIEVPESLSAFRFDMNFMKESRYGDRLMLMAQSEDNTYQFAYRNGAGEALCRMALEIR